MIKRTVAKATKITRLIANPPRTLYPSRPTWSRGGQVYAVFRTEPLLHPRAMSRNAAAENNRRPPPRYAIGRREGKRERGRKRETERERWSRSSPHRAVAVFRRDNGTPFGRKRTATRGDARGGGGGRGRGRGEGKSVGYSEAST